MTFIWKIGAEAFAKVGHYLQMVDNKATALSVAYDPSNAMSEAASLTPPGQFSSVNQCTRLPIASGAGATTTRSDVKAKSDEVANFKLDKANQESQIIIFQGKLEDAPPCQFKCGSRDGQCPKNHPKLQDSSRYARTMRLKRRRRLLMYLEVGVEAAIQPKKQPFKKPKIC